MANSSLDPTITTAPTDPDDTVIDLRDRTTHIGKVRRHRSHLQDAMAGFESAIRRPAEHPGDWLADVTRQLAELAGALESHIHVHEGPDSFHADVLRGRPHLTPLVASLQRDHRRLSQDVDHLMRFLMDHTPIDEPDVRARGLALIHQFSRHRERGADLVWEAFNVDIGGET